MRRYRRAKIVATVGPASSSPEMLKKLNQAGVDTFRLNFSHGTHDDHARVHAAIRALESEVGHPIGILQDLQGPKIRVGTIRDGKLEVEAGETIRFVRSGSDGDRDSIPLPHPEIFAAVIEALLTGILTFFSLIASLESLWRRARGRLYASSRGRSACRSRRCAPRREIPGR